MTWKWSPKGCRGTNVEVCSLSMKSPCLLLESYRVRERNVMYRVGLSYPAANQEEKEKRDRTWLALPFMVPGEVCPGRIASVIFIG